MRIVFMPLTLDSESRKISLQKRVWTKPRTSLVHDQDLSLGDATRDDVAASVIAVADAGSDDNGDTSVLVLQRQTVQVRVQGNMRVMAELDTALVPGEGEGQTAGHHLHGDLHSSVGNGVQTNVVIVAGVRGDKGASNVLEAANVQALLVVTEAHVVVISANILDKTAYLLAGVAAGLQGVTNEVNDGTKLVQLDVGLIIPAQPELPGEHLLLNVLQKQTRDEVRAVSRRVQHEQRMLGSSHGVLVADGNLQDVVPQLGVLGSGLLDSTGDNLGAVQLAPAVSALEEPHEQVLPHLDLGLDANVINLTDGKGLVSGLSGRLGNTRRAAATTTRLSLVASLSLSLILLRSRRGHSIAGTTEVRTLSIGGGHLRSIGSHRRKAVGRHSSTHGIVHGGDSRHRRHGRHGSHSSHRHRVTEVAIGVGRRTARYVLRLTLEWRRLRHLEVLQPVDEKLLILLGEGGVVLCLRNQTRAVKADGGRRRVRKLGSGRGRTVVAHAGGSGELVDSLGTSHVLVLHPLQWDELSAWQRARV